MTEEEWLATTNPWKLIKFLCEKPHQPKKWSVRILGWLGRKNFVVSKRKFQLLILAYCHRLEHLITDERDKNALRVAEIYVEELVTVDRLTEAMEICSPDQVTGGSPWLAWFVAFACLVPFGELPVQSDESAAEYTLKLLHCAAALVRTGRANSLSELNGQLRLEWARVRTPESKVLVNLLREIFGNPFRSIKLEPWDADDLTDNPSAYFLVRLRVLN